MAKKNWIQGAIKHPGSFSKAAESAGESTQAYAQAKKGAPGVVGRRARLALVLAKMRAKRRQGK